MAERFPDASVESNVALELKLIDAYDELLRKVELEILRQAKDHDAQAFHLLDAVAGIGKILALVILDEVHDIRRFPRVQDFVSYCRLVKSKKESAGGADEPDRLTGTPRGRSLLDWVFTCGSDHAGHPETRVPSPCVLIGYPLPLLQKSVTNRG